MNPTERTTDIHLRFNKLIDISDNTLNKRFQKRFLQTPCQACGSLEHPLLALDSNIITTDDIRYKYECPVVDGSPLYENDFEGIKITYLLSSRTFAEYYNYNLEDATNQTIFRNNQTRDTQPDYYHVFMNDVRRVCIEHQNESKQTELQIALPIQNPLKKESKKRKLETVVQELHQNPDFTTPTKTKRKK